MSSIKDKEKEINFESIYEEYSETIDGNGELYIDQQKVVDEKRKTIIILSVVAFLVAILVAITVMAVMGVFSPKGLEYIQNSDGNYFISGYAGQEAKLNIPSLYMGKRIVAIQKEAFYKQEQLEDVQLPATVTVIGDYAFYGCTNLSSVYLPVGLQELGAYAFGNCKNLKQIYYEGTKEQWKAIKKSIFWSNMMPTYIVHCSDGDL